MIPKTEQALRGQTVSWTLRLCAALMELMLLRAGSLILQGPPQTLRIDHVHISFLSHPDNKNLYWLTFEGKRMWRNAVIFKDKPATTRRKEKSPLCPPPRLLGP